MKKLLLALALVASSSAMAASDMYVNQAMGKTEIAKQQIDNLEASIPAPARFLVQANLNAIRFQLGAIKSDLSMSLDPNAPGNQPVQTIAECSESESFPNAQVFVARGISPAEATQFVRTKCIQAEGDAMWCKSAVTCAPVSN